MTNLTYSDFLLKKIFFIFELYLYVYFMFLPHALTSKIIPGFIPGEILLFPFHLCKMCLYIDIYCTLLFFFFFVNVVVMSHAYGVHRGPSLSKWKI